MNLFLKPLTFVYVEQKDKKWEVKWENMFASQISEKESRSTIERWR